MRAAALIALMVSLLAHAAAAAPRPPTGQPPRQLAAAAGTGYNPAGFGGYRALVQPSTGDDMYIRNAEHQQARQRFDALFNQVQRLLGGAAPPLAFVPSITPGPGLSEVHGQWDPAQAQVQIDPYAAWGVIADASPIHDGATQLLLAEAAHRPQVSSDIASREGGAQAFADLTAAAAADQAGIPNTLSLEPAGQFDGPYAQWIAQKLAEPGGPQWVLAGQFGNSTPVNWP